MNDSYKDTKTRSDVGWDWSQHQQTLKPELGWVTSSANLAYNSATENSCKKQNFETLVAQGVNRRELFGVVTAAATATWITRPLPAALNDENSPLPTVDTNVNLFQWPCRRLPLDDTESLVQKLQSLGITQAWSGSFEGLLHRDLIGVNQRLAEECQKHSMLIPIGSINPTLPDWEHDLKVCRYQLRMPGIRLHPNYHGYKLDDPRFVKLLHLAKQSGCFVQLAVSMEDRRTQHPLLNVPDVDLSPLTTILPHIGGVKLQLLNCTQRAASAENLVSLPNLYFDIARVDGTDSIPELAQIVGIERLLTGSHAPFLIPEAALIRLHESSQFSQQELTKIMWKNTQQLWSPSI